MPVKRRELKRSCKWEDAMHVNFVFCLKSLMLILILDHIIMVLTMDRHMVLNYGAHLVKRVNQLPPIAPKKTA